MAVARFQTFDIPDSNGSGAERLAAFRQILAERNLDGFIVPRADAYQNEYVPASEERLAWLTGFTGSAGLVFVMKERAVLFVDGRYTVQARNQVDQQAFELADITSQKPSSWLKEVLGGGKRLGYDPWLQTPAEVERYQNVCDAAKAELVAVVENPIDVIWTDRPQEVSAPVVSHPLEYAGRSSSEKLEMVRMAMQIQGADALLLSDPHAVSWLLNIRGGDVQHTPLPLVRAIVPAEGKPRLYVAKSKLSEDVRALVEAYADIEESDRIVAALSTLGENKAKVMVDMANVPSALAAKLTAAGAEIISSADPVTALKALKNSAEIRGSRSAHRRDAVALCRFLSWFDRRAPEGGVTEIDAAIALEQFRAETGVLRDISFPTISAAGPNAALPHYRVTETSNRAVSPGLYLVDSGAQYQDGTTDVTRTVAVGEISEAMKDHFTRVLKGHIAVATARFPKGTTGALIDSFARRALWDIGADFDHGTGHGVGSYLSVHEGPARISRVATVALMPGMILSNEPGYYREGAYGIRLENLLLVKQSEIPCQERPMFEFETLTLAPFDRRAIVLDLLTRDEWQWLDRYHARVLAEIGPDLDSETREWLEAACAPL